MDTYAIVKTGGKQYRVEPGQRLLVERLPDPEGAEIQLETLMLRDSAVKLGDDLGGATVTAKILGHERGEKLRVFKFKPKRGYKRSRQSQTLAREEGGRRRWRIRRASAQAATAATPMPNVSA
jgi:large subunit ribosomal protein L21